MYKLYHFLYYLKLMLNKITKLFIYNKFIIIIIMHSNIIHFSRLEKLQRSDVQLYERLAPLGIKGALEHHSTLSY